MALWLPQRPLLKADLVAEMVTRFAGLAVISIGVLYLTVWPHELGHSVVAYLYGCKTNWWQTDTSWFLWSSWGGPIDYGCLHRLGGAALGLTEFGGIAVNLLLLGVAPVLGRWWRIKFPSASSGWPWLFFATFLWALANYAEAFSYLVFNTAWLKSDMRTVVTESRVNRWIWFGTSTVLAIAVAGLLLKPTERAAEILAAQRGSRQAWLRRFALYVLATSAVMAAGRIVLT